MPGTMLGPFIVLSYLVAHFSPQLEGALDKGHEVTLEALPKDVLLSKEAMGAILYFLGALTGKWRIRSSFIYIFGDRNESLNESPDIQMNE